MAAAEYATDEQAHTASTLVARLEATVANLIAHAFNGNLAPPPKGGYQIHHFCPYAAEAAAEPAQHAPSGEHSPPDPDPTVAQAHFNAWIGAMVR